MLGEALALAEVRGVLRSLRVSTVEELRDVVRGRLVSSSVLTRGALKRALALLDDELRSREGRRRAGVAVAG